MKNVAPLRYDVIFKKAFSDPEIFTAVVKDFLDIDLEIDKVQSEKIFNPPIGSVETRFDLFAEDKKNRIIVEMQHKHYPDAYERFLYYQCAAMVETIKSSKNYFFPVSVITLVFFTGKNSPSPDSEIFLHDFEARELVSGKVIEHFYKHKHKLIFIFTKSVQQNTPENYREWMQAIDDSLDEEVNDAEYHNPQIHRLFDMIEKDQITPKERARMKDEYNQVTDIRTVFQEGEEKGKAEGMIAGMKAGERKGKAAGRKEGKAAGMKAGERKGIIETAISFKALGALTDEQIAKATGLSLKEIQDL